MEVRRIGDTLDTLGEGVIWDDHYEKLWWVDIKAPAVRCWDSRNDTVRSWQLRESVGSLSLRRAGGVLLAVRSGFALLLPSNSTFHRLAEPESGRPHLRFNDGKCDHFGRFWAGTMLDEPPWKPEGALWMIGTDRVPKRMAEGFSVPNSIAFSPDGRTMYFADSPTRKIWAWPLRAKGGLGERRLFAEVEPPGYPDGATVDAEGHLWSAEWDGGRLVRYTPAGKVERVVTLPVKRPTCCAFGGKRLATLFVTSAAEDGPETSLLAGAMLAFEPGPRGLPEPRWGG